MERAQSGRSGLATPAIIWRYWPKGRGRGSAMSRVTLPLLAIGLLGLQLSACSHAEPPPKDFVLVDPHAAEDAPPDPGAPGSWSRIGKEKGRQSEANQGSRGRRPSPARSRRGRLQGGSRSQGHRLHARHLFAAAPRLGRCRLPRLHEGARLRRQTMSGTVSRMAASLYKTPQSRCSLQPETRPAVDWGMPVYRGGFARERSGQSAGFPSR